MRLRAWSVLVLAACTGDSGDGADTDTDGGVGTACAGEMSATIGTGATSYLPLAEGDPVTLVHGPQGGWHVETAITVSSSGQEVSLAPKIVVPSLGLQIAGEQQPQFVALAGYDETTCEGQFWGARAFVDDADPPPDGMNMQEFICSLEGVTLEFSVTVTDIATQESATSTVNVVAELDPSDAANPPPQGCATN